MVGRGDPASALSGAEWVVARHREETKARSRFSRGCARPGSSPSANGRNSPKIAEWSAQDPVRLPKHGPTQQQRRGRSTIAPASSSHDTLTPCGTAAGRLIRATMALRAMGRPRVVAPTRSAIRRQGVGAVPRQGAWPSPTGEKRSEPLARCRAAAYLVRGAFGFFLDERL